MDAAMLEPSCCPTLSLVEPESLPHPAAATMVSAATAAALNGVPPRWDACPRGSFDVLTLLLNS